MQNMKMLILILGFMVFAFFIGRMIPQSEPVRNLLTSLTEQGESTTITTFGDVIVNPDSVEFNFTIAENTNFFINPAWVIIHLYSNEWQLLFERELDDPIFNEISGLGSWHDIIWFNTNVLPDGEYAVIRQFFRYEPNTNDYELLRIDFTIERESP